MTISLCVSFPRQLFRMAIDMDPRNGDLLDALGQVILELGRPQDALEISVPLDQPHLSCGSVVVVLTCTEVSVRVCACVCVCVHVYVRTSSSAVQRWILRAPL